ncbi:FtsX-like permease family protein [Nitrospira tepida]|uniref:FtsX-like permease family protein n=2 Tax=Nitrospira tepida TaxID=2973512 RepID=A0AA86N3J4_9BACT|nr:FtsX-like permease family protein [Nitrospira tepida]
MTGQLAIRVLARNPLRTGLTMLGIVIGIGAVVTMVSVGEGASALIQSEISSLGLNAVIIVPGATTVGGVRSGLGGVSTLTVDDAREIQKRVRGVSLMTYATRGVLQVVRENKNWNTVVTGVTASLPDIRDWPVEAGTFFSQSDEDVAAKVAVLGRTVAQNLFERGEEIVGAQIRIKNVPLRVLGVLKPKGQSFTGQDQDDIVFLPFSTAERKVLGTKLLGTVGAIFVKAGPEARMSEMVQDVRELLRARHRLHQTEEDDFTVRTMEDVAKMSAGTSRTMMLLLLGIASIALLVGGIGIMNILLVSVTERTREIGIRMALGAKRQDILLQFLMEAVVLSSVGGLLGVLVGIGGARVLSGLAGWPVTISLDAIVVAVLFSVAVGIFFGLYPANRASRLNPIEALHYE